MEFYLASELKKSGDGFGNPLLFPHISGISLTNKTEVYGTK